MPNRPKADDKLHLGSMVEWEERRPRSTPHGDSWGGGKHNTKAPAANSRGEDNILELMILTRLLSWIETIIGAELIHNGNGKKRCCPHRGGHTARPHAAEQSDANTQLHAAFEPSSSGRLLGRTRYVRPPSAEPVRSTSK